MKLILASRSPRRRQLLREAGYRFDVIPPSPLAEQHQAEQHPYDARSPRELVARLATAKARDVARRVDCGLVLGCDTVAECRGRILGKPDNRRHAREMLRFLRGRRHRVLSGLCLWHRPDDRKSVEVAVTTLRMDAVSDTQLERYLDEDQWEGKAGAFGYQDRLGWIHVECGSESNVVGLPLELFREMLGRYQTKNGE